MERYWPQLTADLAQHQGIDVWDRVLMASRPFAWLRTAVVGVLSQPVVAWRDEPADDGKHVERHPVMPNRTRAAIYADMTS